MNIPGNKSAEKAKSAQSAKEKSPSKNVSEDEDSSSSDSNGLTINETSKSGSPTFPYKDAQFKTAKLFDDVKTAETNDILQDIETSIFIPKFVQKKDVADEDNYRLYYGPSNAFMFITFFYSVYERILKARQLVK